MARAAGVSRHHLSRELRDRIGIGPRHYSRLARFQSGLVYAFHLQVCDNTGGRYSYNHRPNVNSHRDWTAANDVSEIS
jgi:hypothetical protein